MGPKVGGMTDGNFLVNELSDQIWVPPKYITDYSTGQFHIGGFCRLRGCPCSLASRHPRLHPRLTPSTSSAQVGMPAAE